MARREGIVPKTLPLLLLLLTSGVATGILAVKDHPWTGSFYTLAVNSRDTIGLIVQVVSTTLGACQVFAITSIVNLSTRLFIQSRRLTQFHKLRFVAIITSGSSHALRSTLPSLWFTLALVIVISLKIPAALWAGTLTPTLTRVTKNEGNIKVPSYKATLDQLGAWQSGIRRSSNGTIDQTLFCGYNMTADFIIPGGISSVSTCPAVDLIGTLLGPLTTSTTSNTSFPKPHARVDGSGWTSLGRSFGVGSSPGAMAVRGLSRREAPLLSFDYNETGYRADVSCLRNASSNFQFRWSDTAAKDNILVAMASGTLPNSVPGQVEEYFVAPIPYPLSFLAWTAISNDGRNILAVAANGWYNLTDKGGVPSFDQMQCDIQFVPSQFAVHVDINNTTITATPTTDNAEDIEPTGQFCRSIILALEQISRISGQNVISTLGTPLGHGAELLRKSDPQLSTEQVNTLALQAGVERLLDSLLVANAQSQMVILNASTTVPVKVTYQAVKFGSNKYVFAVLATNVALLLVALIEAARTQFWKDLDKFDPTDIEDVGIAVSAGGPSIAKRCLLTNGHLSPNSGNQPLELMKYKGHWVLTALPGKSKAMSYTGATRDESFESPLWTWKQWSGFEMMQQQTT